MNTHDASSHLQAKGRGTSINPPNRFESIHVEEDLEHVEFDEEYLAQRRKVKTEYFVDSSRTIVAENESSDIPFRFSINPYRGCSHGCAYCYARPFHEYLGLSGGIDFETKIFVKTQAPDLLRDFLNRPQWQPELIAFSGVTDCYQPAERHFQLTRGCLEVALEARQPLGIVTKNALITRDLDLLKQMNVFGTVSVALSITTLDQSLSRLLEPRTSAPEARLRALKTLNDAGIPTKVMVAPIIPGLNDSDMASVLEAAKEAGVQSASYILLRLPFSVEPVFVDWLHRHVPEKAERVLNRIRSTRDGELSSSQFGERMRGTGEMAKQIQRSFEVFTRKFRLDSRLKPLETRHFRPPRASSGQKRLF